MAGSTPRTHDWTATLPRDLTHAHRHRRHCERDPRPGSIGPCGTSFRGPRGAFMQPADAGVRGPGAARDRTGGRRTHRRTAAPAGGSAARARDGEPALRKREEQRSTGLPPRRLASGEGSVRLRGHARGRDAQLSPTPRGRSTSAAAARVQVDQRSRLRDDPTAISGASRGRACSAAGVLPAERATAARVLRWHCAGGCTGRPERSAAGAPIRTGSFAAAPATDTAAAVARSAAL
jgi:hypothetical protein